jgi:peptidoglycan/xylan/chitin deacetylase (PgdA/CDA1 family)
MKWLYTIAFIFVLCLPKLSGSSFYYPLDSVSSEGKKQHWNQVPVLCYHNITKNGEKEGPLWIGEERFNEQVKMLHDSGYHTILPEQLYQHFTKGAALPSRPILLTFDDTREAHFSIAKAVMDRYGFKGVFFIMTVCVGKKNYMTAGQIKALVENGHAIGLHTYDHPSVTTLKGNQWETQIAKPKQTLERIT